MANPVKLTWKDRNSSNFRRFVYVEDEQRVPKLIDLKSDKFFPKIRLSEVMYYLYTQRNRDFPDFISNGNIFRLRSSRFNPSKKSVFIIHGWNNDVNSDVNVLLKKAILGKYDVNVFVVDWHDLAEASYSEAKNAVVFVGKSIAKFIRGIQKLCRFTRNDFTLIGHSLGAHVAGCAGAALNGQIKTIIGLDPTGLLFTMANTDVRLDYTDAQFVQAIHTADGTLGWNISYGHADFFPNSGSSQPGCGLDVLGTCAHRRSYKYLAESISRDDDAFIGFYCSNYEKFETGACNNNKRSTMGRMEVDTSARGTFFLHTNSEKPFGLGKKTFPASTSSSSSSLCEIFSFPILC